MKKRYVALALAGALAAALFKPVLASQGSGCLPTTGTVSGLTMTQNINSALAALTSMFSGASAPSTDCSAAPVKGQQWLDTSVTPNLVKQYDGNSWIVIGAMDATNHVWSPPIGGGAAAVTAASTTNICAAPAAVQTISGTTTITGFGSDCVIGARKTLLFSAATPVTYNATSLIIPGQRSYTSAAGDVAEAIYLGSGNWRILSISKIDGSSVTNPAVPMGTVLYGDFAAIPAKTLVGTGQAISRSSYPDYLAAVTRTQSGTLTAGNNTITSITSGGTRGFGVGMPIEGTGIQAGTTVVSVTSTTVVLSQTATANGAQNFTVFLTGYGSGGDTTTVGVKNCAGSVIAGLDPSASRLGSAAAINSFQGNKEHTLLASQIPAHNHPVFLNDPGHTHGVSGGTIAGTGGTQYQTGASLGPLGASAINIGTNTTSISVRSASGGGGTANQTADNSSAGGAHPIVQPTTTAECVVVVLP